MTLAEGSRAGGAGTAGLEWVRDLLTLSQRSEVPTVPFVKQLGAVAGRELGARPKGGDWDRWPEDLKFRGFSPGR